MKIVLSWQDCVVPFAMKSVGLESYLFELFVGYGNTFGIRIGVQLGMYDQSLGSARMSNQFNDGLQGRQRLASPVLRDEREQAVFDLVPFARAGRKVCDGDLQPGIIRQILQGDLPQAATGAVAAAAIRGDQQFPGASETGGAPSVSTNDEWCLRQMRPCRGRCRCGGNAAFPRRGVFSSAIPARTVVCDICVASATAVTPPQPISRASLAAHNRRERSLRPLGVVETSAESWR